MVGVENTLTLKRVQIISNMLGNMSERVRNALHLASSHHFTSLAFPLLGAGTGGVSPAVAEKTIAATIALHEITSDNVRSLSRATSSARRSRRGAPVAAHVRWPAKRELQPV